MSDDSSSLEELSARVDSLDEAIQDIDPESITDLKAQVSSMSDDVDTLKATQDWLKEGQDDLYKWADDSVVKSFDALIKNQDALYKWADDDTKWDDATNAKYEDALKHVAEEHNKVRKEIIELVGVLRGDVNKLSERIDKLEDIEVLIKSVSPPSAKPGDTVTVVLAEAPKQEPKSVTIADKVAEHFKWDQQKLTATCKVAAGTPTGHVKAVAVYADAQGKGLRLAYDGLAIQIAATGTSSKPMVPSQKTAKSPSRTGSTGQGARA